MSTATKHRFIIVFNTKCEICDSVIQDAIEVSETNIAAMSLQGFMDINGKHITVFGKEHVVACSDCWENIKNG